MIDVKKYIGLVFPLLLPYAFVFGMGGIVLVDGRIFERVFNGRFDIFLMCICGLLVLSMALTIVTAIVAIAGKWSAEEVAKAGMTVKLLHIPAYILIFMVGIWICVGMVIAPFMGILFLLFDCMVIFMTGIIGAAAAWRGYKEGTLNRTEMLLLAAGQFIFCVDVICVVVLYIMTGKKRSCSKG